jgi:trigger factor
MNILRENIEHLNDIITIEIDETDYHEQVEKSLKDLKRKANIPGFRPGHVPMGMINKMYRNLSLLMKYQK